MTTVVHITPVWLPQTQTWMYNQVRYLPPSIDAHVICHRTENLDQFSLPNIHCLADEPAFRRYLYRQIRKLTGRKYSDYLIDIGRKVNAKVIHSHFGPDGWVNIGVARRLSAKHVVTFYGFDVNFLPRLAPIWYEQYAVLFSAVDRILCEGPHMAASIAALGCPEDKISVHRLGIALEDIPFRPLSWRSGEPLRVLIAAAFREKKGIPYAIEALGRLKGRIPFEVTVIGEAREPREQLEKQRILETVERFGLAEQVKFTGFQSHARMLAQASRHHLFLSPSATAEDGDTEGGAPVSLIEMCAAGMLVVSTTHCDIPEIVIDRKTGILANEHDVTGLVDAIEWLCENPDRWQDMRAAARLHVEQNFNARIQGERLARIYTEIAYAKNHR